MWRRPRWRGRRSSRERRRACIVRPRRPKWRERSSRGGGENAGFPLCVRGTRSTHSKETNMAESPTIVLVHGAWADATGWEPEIGALQERGYSVIGFGNPLRDLAGDAAYLADFLRTLSGPIVLVG